MKNAVIVLSLVAGAVLIYKVAFANTETYKAYERFANALLVDRYDVARDMTVSDDVKALIARRERRVKRMGYDDRRLLRGIVHQGPFRWIEIEDADGDRVTYRVIQEVRRGPFTLAGAGPPNVRHTQDLVMIETENGWKVESFEEKLTTMTNQPPPIFPEW